MKSLCSLAPIVGAALLTAGCMETMTLVNVNKDGSGTITLRVHVSEQTVAQMAGAGAGMMSDVMADAVGTMVEGVADAVGALIEEPGKVITISFE